jgi:hypothetical protein
MDEAPNLGFRFHNMLLGQYNYTPHAAVGDRLAWSSGGIMIRSKKPENSENNLLQCHLVHHEYI